MANVHPTLELLEAMRRRGGGRVVFASSGGTVYGRLAQVPTPETHALAPITAYGAGKAAAELYLGLYRALHGLDCRVARLANPYGAGQNLARRQGAVTTFCDLALRGEPIAVWGDGEVTRDYLYVGDAAAALAALALAPAGEDFVFNFGAGVGRSLNAILAEIEAQLGRRLDVRYGSARAFDVQRSVLAIDRAARVLDWRPRVTFSEGVARTLADLAADARLARLD